MNLSKYIGEGTLYDKKEKLETNKPKSWLKTVSAFANGIGGALIFGISDKEEIIGLDNYKKDSENISEIIKTKIEPLPKVTLKHYLIEDKNIIILFVHSGKETPYYFTEGGHQTAYIRLGNESIPAKNSDLINLILKGKNRSYDSLGTDIKKDNVSFTKLKSLYYLKTGNEFTDSDLESFGLVNKDNFLTNAGALLADEPIIKHSRIFCTRWNGLDMTSGIEEALNDNEFEGSILLLLQNAENFIKVNTKKKWKKGNESRIEMPDYPERAIQEVLVNAIIHRDYAIIGSEIHIDIYDDRIEIYSPGGMFDGSFIQEQNIMEISSLRRNPIIADLFNRIHLMERRGSGLKKIISSYQNAINYTQEKEVEFKSTQKDFKVILKNLNYKVAIKNGDKVAIKSDDKVAIKIQDEQLKKILEYIKKYNNCKTSDIENLLSVKSSRARKLLSILVSEKKIQALGQNKNRYYVLSE
ncbi:MULTISPECIES: ATP-binding protein [Fusobacterium]|uniref:ATP-binding protein n=1 Tax=Fusobacterium nucleatum TaxID=851 RepID=A0AAX3M8C7_FUSNU|nr:MULTISPECIES: ATP-binding protein [Fusobacterium]OFL32059.1 AAA family ATPase [Fusobacterium sp. HMSC064B12]WDA43248.1 ATP-binding protein [Fusobacterium nucleatum]